MIIRSGFCQMNHGTINNYQVFLGETNTLIFFESWTRSSKISMCFLTAQTSSIRFTFYDENFSSSWATFPATRLISFLKIFFPVCSIPAMTMEDSRTQRPYRYGMILLCLGALINWLGISEPTPNAEPIRYLGVACILGKLKTKTCKQLSQNVLNDPMHLQVVRC